MKLEEALKTDKFLTQNHKASLNILYTAWWLKTSLSAELKSLGITHEQYNVLRILNGKHPEPMCVKDIGSRLIEQNSNVPRIIDRLVAKELVDRNNSLQDKRETIMNLTTKGITVLHNATQGLNEKFKTWAVLSENEARMLNDLLERFREKQ